MAEVIILHHALGLTPGAAAVADHLRREGHIAHTPELFAGRTCEDLQTGVAQEQEVGGGRGNERGVRAAEGFPAEVVHAGFSLGVLPAQLLAQTRPGARGALLYHSCIPLGEFAPEWPDGVPVQIHGMEEDPIFAGEGDLDAARGIAETTDSAELFLYEGDQHYFADRTLPSYREDAAALLQWRTLDLLRTVG